MLKVQGKKKILSGKNSTELNSKLRQLVTRMHIRKEKVNPEQTVSRFYPPPFLALIGKWKFLYLIGGRRQRVI